MAYFQFKKSDLTYKDYQWKTTEDDSAQVMGFPDNVILNRHEGYEMVAFIDRYIRNQPGWKSQSDERKRESGNRIESMIHNHLPSLTRSHANVKLWVGYNWEKSI